jgi:hypothetical protein
MKILTAVISGLIGLFFLLSVAGWFTATSMVMSGQLGQKILSFYDSLNSFDHFIRVFQVLLALAASITLILYRKTAQILFGISLIMSFISYILIPKWAITFLPFPILIPVFLYTYWLSRRGYLK